MIRRFLERAAFYTSLGVEVVRDCVHDTIRYTRTRTTS